MDTAPGQVGSARFEHDLILKSSNKRAYITPTKGVLLSLND